MASKADFTPEEWTLLLQAPPCAGLIVVTAERGGTFRETIAVGKAYAEAQHQPGKSELIDEIVASKPAVEHAHDHSPEEMKQRCLTHIRDAAALLASKAPAEEVAEYKAFVLSLAEKVAAAHSEAGKGGDPVSEKERAAIAEITQALG